MKVVEADASPDTPGRSGRKAVRLALVAMWVVAAVMIGVRALDDGPGDASDAEVLERIAQLSDLPDEQPIVATIENVEQLQEQDSFYNGAANGDRVIVFVQSSRALIYSPNDDRLVRDGTISGSPLP